MVNIGHVSVICRFGVHLISSPAALFFRKLNFFVCQGVEESQDRAAQTEIALFFLFGFLY